MKNLIRTLYTQRNPFDTSVALKKNKNCLCVHVDVTHPYSHAEVSYPKSNPNLTGVYLSNQESLGVREHATDQYHLAILLGKVLQCFGLSY